MSIQVAIALGVVIATMIVALVGILLRRRAAAGGPQLPSMPRWVLILLLGVGALLLAVVVGGFLALAL